MVGLDNLEGLFQTKWFHDSMITIEEKRKFLGWALWILPLRQVFPSSFLQSERNLVFWVADGTRDGRGQMQKGKALWGASQPKGSPRPVWSVGSRGRQGREIVAWKGIFGLGQQICFSPPAATQTPFFTLQDAFSSAHSVHRTGMLDW